MYEDFNRTIGDIIRWGVGLTCCGGVFVLLAWMLGFFAEVSPNFSKIFRCKERHPKFGRCALGPHHLVKGQSAHHRGKYGGSWL